MVHTGDRLQSDIQARTRENTEAVNRVPFLRGRLVTCKFAAGGTYYTFTHALGVPAACFVIRQNYDAGGGAAGPTFAENPNQTGVDQRNQLSLAANNICTVDMWFYPRASVALKSGAIQAP